MTHIVRPECAEIWHSMAKPSSSARKRYYHYYYHYYYLLLLLWWNLQLCHDLGLCRTVMKVLLWSHASSGQPSVRLKWSQGCCAPSWAAWSPSCSRTWCTTSMMKKFRTLRQQKMLTMEMRRIRRSSPSFAGSLCRQFHSVVLYFHLESFSCLDGSLLQLSGWILATYACRRCAWLLSALAALEQVSLTFVC